MYKVKEPRCVVVYGLKTAFGGGRSTGFCLIYDNLQAVKDFEPKHRLIRVHFSSDSFFVACFVASSAE
jgi:small subunit ribosomal protein S24e